MDPVLTTTAVNDAITTLTTDVGNVLVAGLGAILGLLAVLIGLFFVIRLIRKWVSRGK